ncbi:MAG: hypothetical protein AB2L24_21850 [Mangrovibacterium sp.]
MKEIKGIDALRLATEISKLPDGRFTIVFFPYNSTKGEASTTPRVIERCKVRTQLPEDKFSRDSENFFLFEDEKGLPKTCYRILIRFIGFSSDNYQLRKVKWT